MLGSVASEPDKWGQVVEIGGLLTHRAGHVAGGKVCQGEDG